MISKPLLIFSTLCAVVLAQKPANRFTISDSIVQKQCGGGPDQIANPRLCFQTSLNINKDAAGNKGEFEGYSSTNGTGKSHDLYAGPVLLLIRCS